jgi:cyclohexanone monooxygenase
MADSETRSIDYDAISRRYDEERAKRLRGDGVEQWIEIKTEAAHFDTDHYADPDFKREPVVEDVDALIIGAGVAGLLAGGRLREKGVENLRIVEKGADFGGTWYWNRYPGLHCDVESYIYMPMVEELGVMPTEKYATGYEIREHCQRLARHYDLYRGALFQTVVTDARWDEDRHRWIVGTDRGDRIATRFLISATGILGNPKLPGIPGIDDFKGHSFHTSRWDFGYTGGDEEGNMTGLADKRVGLIGTGATAVQLVPRLAKSVGRLYVFQRTPSPVDARGNGPTDPAWFNSLEPGWTRQRRDNFTIYLSGGQVEEKLVDDGWTDILPRLDPKEAAADPDAYRKAAMRKMERIRGRVDEFVKDKATAEALKPWYHFFCKRPTFADDYLQTFNEPNVTLVDSQGQGVERITAKGVVVLGKEYELDCLIYGTGFDYNVQYSKDNGVEFIGRGGHTLSDYWADGPRTLWGMQTHGFPNFMFMRVAQAGGSANFTHIADEQAEHIAWLVSEALKRGVVAVEPSREVEDAWVDTIVSQAGPRLAFHASCTPGYYNHEGKVSDRLARYELYTGGPMGYNRLLADWRAEGSMKGLDVTKSR